MTSPLFSIIIPSRNRQNLLKYTLESLQMQDFQDFEVVVSDNSDDHQIAIEMVKNIADPRFKIVCTPSVLNMIESYNFALSHASGKYVTILSNRVMLFPGALSKVFRVLEKFKERGEDEMEIVNWMVDWFSFNDEEKSHEGIYHIQHDIHKPKIFDSINELKYRLSFCMQIGKGVRCFRGQIYYGFFSRELLQRINESVGQYCFGISPDYTLLALGLLNSTKSCDIGMSLSLMISSKTSMGMQNSSSDLSMRKFLNDCFKDKTVDELAAEMPIKGVYNSLCNTVAYDYASMIKKSKKLHLLKFLSLKNLCIRVIEDSANSDVNLFNEGFPSKRRLKFLKLNNSLSKSFYHIKDGFWLNKVMFKIMKNFVKNEFYLDKERQNQIKPNNNVIKDPIAALKFGHEHYKSLKSLDYK